MPPSNPYIQIFAVVAPIISWILVINGWILVRRDNNRREDRHEWRTIIDTIIDEIKELELKAYNYYQTDPADVTANVALLESEMKRGQNSIGTRIVRLRRRTGSFASQDEYQTFRNIVTGGDFEQNNRPKRPASDARMSEISYAAGKLTDYLELEYENLVPHTRDFWKFWRK